MSNLIMRCAMLVVLFFLATVAQALDSWVGTGPFATGQGNRVVRTLAVSADGMKVYAGTGSGTVFNYAYSDTTAPTLSASVSGITQTGAVLTATSSETGNVYWIVVARNATAPSSAQVKAGATYSGVSIVVSGSGAVSAAVARTFSIAGLMAATDYDLYVVAEDAGANLCAPVKVSFTTSAIVDTTPDPFVFFAQTGVAPSSVVTSNTITVTGINSPSPISIAGGTYSINGGTFVSAPGSVGNGQTVSVRLVASASNGVLTTATLSIGGVNGVFDVTTQSAMSDTTPDPFSFAPQYGVAPSSVATSNTITVTGINSPSPISIAGGTYSINGGAFVSAPGSVSNGQMVTLRLSASASAATKTSAILTIGGVNGTFNITTAGGTAVPTLSEWAMLLLAGLLVVIGITPRGGRRAG